MKNRLAEEPIKIVILGRPMVGKTTLTVLLLKFLMEHGMDVSVIPEHGAVPHEVGEVIETLPARLKAMQGKPIFIEQVQAHRHHNFSEPIEQANPVIR